MTLTHAGEQALDMWLHLHARVCWVEHQQPWILEDRMLEEISLPLNLEGNNHHPFYPRLREIRAQAIDAAKKSVIASEKGTTRKAKRI